MTDDRPIEVGDRFLTKDKRDAGRVIEVREIDVDRPRADFIRVVVEVNPSNPSTVGRQTWATPETLRRRFTRISR